MTSGAVVIDAAVRFARSNPELLGCAREGALRTGRSADDLLLEAIARMRGAIEQAEPSAQRRPYRSRSTESARRTDSSAYS